MVEGGTHTLHYFYNYFLHKIHRWKPYRLTNGTQVYKFFNVWMHQRFPWKKKMCPTEIKSWNAAKQTPTTTWSGASANFNNVDLQKYSCSVIRKFYAEFKPGVQVFTKISLLTRIKFFLSEMSHLAWSPIFLKLWTYTLWKVVKLQPPSFSQMCSFPFGPLSCLA